MNLNRKCIQRTGYALIISLFYGKWWLCSSMCGRLADPRLSNCQAFNVIRWDFTSFCSSSVGFSCSNCAGPSITGRLLSACLSFQYCRHILEVCFNTVPDQVLSTSCSLCWKTLWWISFLKFSSTLEQSPRWPSPNHPQTTMLPPPSLSTVLSTALASFQSFCSSEMFFSVKTSDLHSFVRLLPAFQCLCSFAITVQHPALLV